MIIKYLIILLFLREQYCSVNETSLPITAIYMIKVFLDDVPLEG